MNEELTHNIKKLQFVPIGEETEEPDSFEDMPDDKEGIDLPGNQSHTAHLVFKEDGKVLEVGCRSYSVDETKELFDHVIKRMKQTKFYQKGKGKSGSYLG